MCYHTSTSVLSTSSSSGVLQLRWDIHLEGASRLDAFSVYPVGSSAMLLAEQWIDQRVSPSRSSKLGDSSSPVYPTPTPDRPNWVSRRSEPSSRTALPANSPTLGPTSAPGCDERHRGAKPLIDVNSWSDKPVIPRVAFYPLSDGKSTLYHRITKSYFRTCSTPSVSQSSSLLLFVLFEWFPTILGGTLSASDTARRRPPQSNSPPDIVPDLIKEVAG